MKTPVLTLLPKHSKESLDKSIKSYLDTVSCVANLNQSIDVSLKQALYGLCYKVFFYDGVFVTGKRYTISDACFYIPGMFKSEMISFINDIVSFCDKSTQSTTACILSNCVSYELFQMLYSEPLRVYACLIYSYGYNMQDTELMELSKSFIAEKSSQPTLDWELLYLKFMERYENDI